MTPVRPSNEEIARRGEEIYERDIRPRAEAEHWGEFLIVDIDTGDHDVDPDEVAVMKRAMVKRPDGIRYLIRVGYPAVHRLGGRFLVNDPR